MLIGIFVADNVGGGHTETPKGSMFTLLKQENLWGQKILPSSVLQYKVGVIRDLVYPSSIYLKPVYGVIID